MCAAMAACATAAKPLILTPLIDAGKFQEAQTQSRVHLPELPDVLSYSGYMTTNASSNGNTFFWYFPPRSGKADAPTTVWLQGGPGGSSLFGLFTEMGPITLTPEGKVTKTEITWNQDYGQIFIDNPLGVGYSFTDKAGLATDRQDYMTTLYSFINQFYRMFPALQKNDFYIAGESYAGKYVPAFAYQVHVENAKGTKPHIPLKGIMVGDGLCDPESMVQAYPDLTEQFSLVNWNQKKVIQNYVNEIDANIKAKKWRAAFDGFDLMINGDLSGKVPYLANVTGFTNYFNALSPVYPTVDTATYLNKPEIRAALHVGDKSWAGYDRDVEVAIVNDVAQSMRDLFPTLLDNYKVLLYSGQFDVIVGAPLTIKFLRSLQWSGSADFETAERKIWHSRSPVVGTMGKLLGTNKVAGWATQAKNLQYVIVRNAGHMVPSDQPLWALDMIMRFVRDMPFDGPIPADLPNPKAPSTIASELERLVSLKTNGHLTEEEFVRAKAKLL